MDAIRISAVAFQENGLWIARCLEYNFFSCAETLDELADELLRQVQVQIEADLEAGHEPFFGFKPAPRKYWDLFEAAKAVSKPVQPRKPSQRLLKLPERSRVETQLIPVADAA